MESDLSLDDEDITEESILELSIEENKNGERINNLNNKFTIFNQWCR